jgi:hypothetical protein
VVAVEKDDAVFIESVFLEVFGKQFYALGNDRGIARDAQSG